jgi:murein DD-endopeptidase MepM/ murein hydrolase activator NlpD
LASQQRPRSWSGRPNRILVLTIAAISCGTGIASAAGGGVGTGSLPDPPELRDLSCLEKCAAEHSAAEGATVALTGKGLGQVKKINFKGQGAPISAKPVEVTRSRVETKVPQGAVSGKPNVADRYGQSAKSPVPLEVVGEEDLPAPGEGGTGDITVNLDKAFFDSAEPLMLTYLFKGAEAGSVRIELVDRIGGSVVTSWVQEGVQPGSYGTLEWDGTLDGEQAAPAGDYKFRVGPNGGTLEDGGQNSFFSLYDHKFPIRGKHTYGDGVGAPREGHTHQGQDLFAKCGAPLVAARGGRVQYKGYHSAAGNYLVIDGKGTGRDYVYMHLQDKALVAEGEHVYTGQEIGAVGESGNASGCHLHFELWSAPGWYEGGAFLKSVTKELKKWDSWS